MVSVLARVHRTGTETRPCVQKRAWAARLTTRAPVGETQPLPCMLALQLILCNRLPTMPARVYATDSLHPVETRGGALSSRVQEA